jgi:hypothetical protein
VNRGVTTVEVDGAPLDSSAGIPLTDDAKPHRVRIVLG